MAKLEAYKVAMQCANIKFTSTAFNNCEMVRISGEKRKFVPISILSVSYAPFQ